MGIRKGTKLTDTPKDRTIKIRLDEATDSKLEALCKATGQTKSEVVRAGIEKQYADIKK